MRRRELKVSVYAAIVLTLALLLGLMGGSAQAEFPYPEPSPSPSDPYDYGSYMKTSSPDDMYELNDLGDNDWKYSSRTACELYGPERPGEKFVNCSPLEVNENPQEQFGVTGASVDKAWTTTTGRPDVTIAVLDSGVQWNNLGKPMRDVNNKTWLNHGELPVSGTTGFSPDQRDYDVNDDGIFNIRDYCPDWDDEKDCGGSGDETVRGEPGTADTDYNENGIIDPEDLIFKFSDGIDQDGNGYTDDFVGWDSYEDDNDPFDEVQYGHGSGEAVDSTGEANNKNEDDEGGEVGTCPNCMVMHMRVGDSFIADVNDAAEGMIYAADNGASVLQSALGTLNNSRFAQEAINYAYKRGVVLIASAADESAGHHNQPSVLEHAVTFNSIGEPQLPGAARPPTYLEFRGCTNFGAYITASVPSNSCSSEAVGRMAGVAGLMYSAGRNRFESNGDAGATGGTFEDYGQLDGPGGVPEGHMLSAEEIDQLVARTADDINFTTPVPYTDRSYPETQRYGATEGWDPFFGYGRINARRMVRAVHENAIPPEADITSPEWFDIVDPADPSVQADGIKIKGTVASRRTPKYDYKVEWGIWTWYEADRKNYRSPEYKTTGVTLTHTGDQAEPIDGVLATIDPEVVKAELDAAREGKGTEGPGADPVTGRGDHENRQLPDKFGVVARVVVTSKDGAGAPILQSVQGEVDRANGGSDPNSDEAAATVPLQGIGTKQFYLHNDPALFPGFPRDLEADGAAAPRFADLDDDGVDEIIVATSNGEVHAYKPDGGEVPGWPVHTTDAGFHYDAPAFQSGEITTPVHSAVLRSPAVGDLDRDGDLEVVAGDFQGRIWAWDQDGQVVPGFPVRSNPAYSAPQRPDREAGFYDDHPELVEGRYTGPGTIPNDPDLVPDLVNRHDKLNRVIWWFLASPTLSNIDPDSDSLEILAGAADRHLYAFDATGEEVDGWPMMLRDTTYLQSVDPVTHEISNRVDTEDSDEDGDTTEIAQRFNGAKIVTSPGTGNLDGDPAGTVEILSAVNEQYEEVPNFDDPTLRALCANPPDPQDPTGESPREPPGFNAAVQCGNQRLYAMSGEGRNRVTGEPHATGHPNADDYVPGWPARVGSLLLELLPVVGNGPDGSPILGQVNTANPGLEVGIYGTAGPGYILRRDGRSLYGKNPDGQDRVLLTDALGPGSNSPDAPSIPAVGGAIFSTFGEGRLGFVAPAAGLGKLLDVALPDDQLLSDNHLSIWETFGEDAAAPRDQIPAFPREVNDLQFLTTAAAADVDGDGEEEILEGTAYNDLHAFKSDGEEPGLKTLDPEGWPKFTGGWTVAPPAVGDWNGDGARDVAHVIREGRMFVWESDGAKVCDEATWPEWGHDGWMTNNVETDAIRPRVITDLTANTTSGGTVIRWTAPGDDGVCGRAHSYDIRRSRSHLTNENFQFARKVQGPPSPSSAKVQQSLLVASDQCDTFVAIQTYDANPATDKPAHPANPSAVSNDVMIPGTAPDDPSCGGEPKTPTRIEIRGRRSGQTTDPVRLKAYLETQAGPVSGETIRFEFQGRSYSATTNADGVASSRVRIRGRSGTDGIVAAYLGSDAVEASTDQEAFTVLHEDSRVKVVAYREDFKRHPRRITLKSRLRDLDSRAPIVGREVAFYVNGRKVGTATTRPNGRAVTEIKRRMRRDDRVRAVFQGDRRFLASRDAAKWRRGRAR